MYIKRMISVRLKYFLVLIGVILFLMLVTAEGWQLTKKVTDQRSRELFMQQVLSVENWLKCQQGAYEAIIYGLEGYLASTDELDWEKWEKYFNKIEINERYKSINSVAYSKPVDGRFTAEYVYPQTRIGALGFDVTSESVRYEAVIKAIEKNQIVSTGKITLVVGGEPGFLLAYPVYKEVEIPDELDERKEAVDGIITMTFKSSDIFSDFSDSVDPFPSLDFELYWGNNTDNENILYDHDSTNYLEKDDSGNVLRAKRLIVLGNDFYTLLVKSKPGYRLTMSQRNLPRYVLGFGITFNLLMFLYFLRWIKKIKG